MLFRLEEYVAEWRVIASACVVSLLSLACRLALTASAGRHTSVCGFDICLPLIALAGLIAVVGLRIGSKPICTLGFGVLLMAVACLYLPDATEAALHLGRGFAYADSTLAAADHTLGFDWIAYTRRMDAHPALWAVGLYAYLSLPALPIVVIVGLSLDGAGQRLATYFVAQLICLTAVAGIAAFVPALGTYEYFRAATLPFAHRDFVTAAHMTQSLEWLRQSHLSGDGVEYHGLVSFPSYHAMSCVLNAWALWRSRWGRWPMAALSLLILIATPVQGSHYLVDIVAGIIIAALAIKPAAWLVAAPFLRRPCEPASSPVLAPA